MRQRRPKAWDMPGQRIVLWALVGVATVGQQEEAEAPAEGVPGPDEVERREHRAVPHWGWVVLDQASGRMPVSDGGVTGTASAACKGERSASAPTPSGPHVTQVSEPRSVAHFTV